MLLDRSRKLEVTSRPESPVKTRPTTKCKIKEISHLLQRIRTVDPKSPHATLTKPLNEVMRLPFLGPADITIADGTETDVVFEYSSAPLKGYIKKQRSPDGKSSDRFTSSVCRSGSSDKFANSDRFAMSDIFVSSEDQNRGDIDRVVIKFTPLAANDDFKEADEKKISALAVAAKKTSRTRFQKIVKSLQGNKVDNIKWHQTISEMLSKNHQAHLSNLLGKYEKAGILTDDLKSKLNAHTNPTEMESSKSQLLDSKMMTASEALLPQGRPSEILNKRMFSKGKKWRIALASFAIGLRLASLYKNVVADYQHLLQTVGPADLPGLANQLRQFADAGDPQFSLKVKKLLQSPTHLRSDETVETLMRILGFRLKSFARFSTTQKMQFCKIMTFQSYPKGKLILKEGHYSTAFFFVLSGQLEVFKVKDSFKHRVGMVYCN